ncbi:MAG TPA: hypothetical protein VN668_18970 [Stellaceae bacterium]|nr:hypothetical protein [Stellaceae bacterium]
MRTKLLTVALTGLLTVGGTAVAFAQAADAITAHRQELAEVTQPSSYSAPQSEAFASATQHQSYDRNDASTGGSPHQQPQG